MSKSLNFVVSIKLDRRSTDVNGNHPIKLRVWNRASKRVKMYSCNKFSDPATFEKAKKMKEDGMSYREISDKLLKKGFTVSKSKLQRKLN